MRYRSEYRDAYSEGIVNRSFSISKVAFDLLMENIESNQSAFVNDLIIEALQEKGWEKRVAMKRLNEVQKDLEKFGYTLEVRNGPVQP